MRADLQCAGSSDAPSGAARDQRYAADLAFLGNRLPDREARVEEFLLRPAGTTARRSASCWAAPAGTTGIARPTSSAIGHVGTEAHNAFNVTPRAMLNVNRASMAATGYSPPTRLFEVAGAGACLITDAWDGIQMFLTPGSEVLVARDGDDVVDIVQKLTASWRLRSARQRGSASWQSIPMIVVRRHCMLCCRQR